MAKIEKFEDVIAWQLARKATRKVYSASSRDLFSRDFALVNQIRRASISVMSNIAEGFERSGNKEFIQFLAIAKGSCGEVRSQMYIPLDRGYIDQNEFDEIAGVLTETSKTISGFMKYLQGSPELGSKFKHFEL